MNILILFIILNVTNVIMQTVKSIMTIKCGKTVAAIVNAVAYGLYTIVLIYMSADLPLFTKAGIVAAANFVGVWVVKWIEEKTRKTKLWKIELAIPAKGTDAQHFKESFASIGIESNYALYGSWYVFNCYCDTKEQSTFLKNIAKKFEGRISAYESAPL